jgi:hypothetical protein
MFVLVLFPIKFRKKILFLNIYLKLFCLVESKSNESII